jgi:hypothetical protein
MNEQEMQRHAIPIFPDPRNPNQNQINRGIIRAARVSWQEHEDLRKKVLGLEETVKRLEQIIDG